MTTDDETLRRYREASAALDERPASAARTAILAAAAREVGARPRAADAPRTWRMRWPLAAAATVMLSTLAVMLASRTEQEIGTFTAPTDASTVTTPETPTAKPAPVPPAASAPESSSAPASPKIAAPAARIERPAETRAAPTPTRQEERRREMPPASDVPAAREQERAAAAAGAPPPPPAAPAEPAAPMREAPSLQRGMSAESGKPSAAAGAGRREAADASASAVELSASEWLERIVQLRAAGRHDEADEELKRFTERYPQVQVPAAARPPTATR